MSESEFVTRFKLLDAAAKKSDRWWFLALLMIGIGWSIWWQYDARSQLAAAHAEIAALHSQILVIQGDLIKHQTEQSAKVLDVVTANTRVLEAVTLRLSAQK